MFKIIKKYKYWLVGLFLLGIIVFFVLGSGSKKDNQYQNELTATKGSISSTVSESGNVKSSQARRLNFGPAGVIAQVNFSEGDKVTKGNLIAKLETTDLEGYVKQSQGQVSLAQTGRSRVSEVFAIDIQQRMLDNALSDLDLTKEKFDLSKDINDYNLEKSKIAVDMSQYNLDAGKTMRSFLISEKNEAVDFYQGLATGQEDLVEIQYDKSISAQRSQNNVTDLSVDIAKIDEEISKLQIDTNEMDIETSIAKLEKALEINQIQLDQAQKNRNYDIQTYNAQLSQAQGALQVAQYNLSRASIIAPFDGIITEIPLKVGEVYTPQASIAVEIVDMENLLVEVYINEVDIADLKVGQSAKIDFDGIENKVFEAEVVKIYPRPRTIDGVIVYQVDISISDLLGSPVFLGMTANVEIITQEKEDILSIPIFAISYEDGRKVVKVKAQDDKIEIREIETGIQSDTEIEIVKGLQEGEVIVY